MSELTDLEWAKRFIEENRLDEGSYGFFISIVTEHDTGIVDIAPLIAKKIRDIGGEIQFSYTFIEPDDDLDEE